MLESRHFDVTTRHQRLLLIHIPGRLRPLHLVLIPLRGVQRSLPFLIWEGLLIVRHQGKVAWLDFPFKQARDIPHLRVPHRDDLHTLSCTHDDGHGRCLGAVLLEVALLKAQVLEEDDEFVHQAHLFSCEGNQ